MKTQAVVLDAPEKLDVRALALNAIGAGDVLVEVALRGVSTGTERLLWTGRMPPFPGMGYPLVPGYESVGMLWMRAPKRRTASASTSSCRARTATQTRAACSAATPRA